MKTLSDLSVTHALQCAASHDAGQHPLHVELLFTRTYQEALSGDKFERELRCLHVLFPAILQPIQVGDRLAGRLYYPLVGLSPEPMGFGYYCCEGAVKTLMAKTPLTPAQVSEVEEMLAFWRTENSQSKVRAAYPPAVAAALPSDDWLVAAHPGFPLYRLGGINLDFDKLLTLGLPGLDRELQRHLESSSDPLARRTYETMRGALLLVQESCRCYADMARNLTAQYSTPAERDMALALADSLTAVSTRPPATFHQAIQLFWIYSLLSATWNYGRMDVYLAPFLARDLANHSLTHDAALDLLQALWRLMNDYANPYNNRIIIGGKGRANEALANEFALLAMEATRTVHANQPQLTLRFHNGQDPRLFDKALTCLAEGRTYPLLYNDDVNVPAVMNAFHVPRDEAEDYVPYGCGEYTFDHKGVGTPSGVLNLGQCLQLALHNGVEPLTKQAMGLRTGDPAGFKTFEDLWAAYAQQVEFVVAPLALQEKIEYQVLGQEAPFTLLSLLSDDCMARGRPLLDGGIRYLGGTLEAYGNTNTADSLAALEHCVYRTKKYTLAQVLAACDADFRGFESLRHDLQEAPKYGNDDPVADAMVERVHRHLCELTRDQAEVAGLHSYLIVIINNSANTVFGRVTAATPDGRRAGEAFANANNPFFGMDRKGPTAFLNSLAKLDPAIHAGAVQNMKFSRSLFRDHRPIVEALLKGYFLKGGTQAMITVVDRNDLESAMREPEKWGHLMVRVGVLVPIS